MNGFDPLSSIISSFRPIETSNSSIDPGNRVDFPNIMFVLLISTKYLVSVNYVESYSFYGSIFSSRSTGGFYYRLKFSTNFSTACCSPSTASKWLNTYPLPIRPALLGGQLAAHQVVSHSLYYKSNILKFSI